jgi:hypothetical protein
VGVSVREVIAEIQIIRSLRYDKRLERLPSSARGEEVNVPLGQRISRARRGRGLPDLQHVSEVAPRRFRVCGREKVVSGPLIALALPASVYHNCSL